ncbi:hypothetical protein BX666DRAFT_1922505 [Dichotomocladium elegans]|nr:hypothetical protein BX666DRAFT_1922505 [Dichotomocladium elegans]
MLNNSNNPTKKSVPRAVERVSSRTCPPQPNRSSSKRKLASAHISGARKGITKRPAWDIRGRVQDMEAQLHDDEKSIGKIQIYTNGLISAAEVQDVDLKEVIKRIARAKADLKATTKNYSREIEDIKALQRIHVQELEDNQLIYTRELATLQDELSNARRTLGELEARTKREAAEHTELKAQVDQSMATLKQIMAEKERLSNEVEAQKASVADCDRMILKLAEQIEAQIKEAAPVEAKLGKKERLASQSWR